MCPLNYLTDRYAFTPVGDGYPNREHAYSPGEILLRTENVRVRSLPLEAGRFLSN